MRKKSWCLRETNYPKTLKKKYFIILSMKKENLITLLVILGVIIISLIFFNNSNNSINEETVKCIGQNSELYTKLGCHACEIQEDMFGENYKYLTVIDCFYDMNRCAEKEITATPTWIINGEKYIGVQSIDKLKELTGC